MTVPKRHLVPLHHIPLDPPLQSELCQDSWRFIVFMLKFFAASQRVLQTTRGGSSERLWEGQMMFVEEQIVQGSRLFHLNVIDIMLNMSVIWRGPNYNLVRFGRSHGTLNSLMIIYDVAVGHKIPTAGTEGEKAMPLPFFSHFFRPQS